MDCLDIRSDRSERVHYNKLTFPVYLQPGILSHFPNYSAESHWHDDLEFIVVISGAMEYNVNGEIVSMKAGEGIFVNARQFHYGFSSTHQECIFLCILFHPMLLCTTPSVEQQFVLPLITNEALPYHKLSTDIPWQAHILVYLKEMYDTRDSDTSQLRCLSLMHALWENLYTHLNIETPIAPARNHHLTALRSMVSFIEAHYKEKIGLAAICKTGNVGKTTCSAIFMKYTNQTPIEYLTDFRLRKGIELMTSTDMTLAEISYEIGFSGASYFTETFRKCYSCSPGEYRRRLTLSEVSSS